MDNLVPESALDLTFAIQSTFVAQDPLHLSLQNSPVVSDTGVFFAPESDFLSELSENNPTTSPASFGNLPLSFIANVGQLDPEVEFLVQGAQHDIFFTPDEIVFSKFQVSNDETLSHQVKVSFADSNPNPTIEAVAPLPGVANFITGDDPSQWHENIPTYQGIAYQNLYDGIDLIYRGDGGELKSEFIVNPGVDPGQIRMNYQGSDRLNIREDGALVIETPFGELVESAPYLYQDINGERVTVTGAYQLYSNAQVGFTIGDYDRSHPLAIDPTLEYINYFGGSGSESANDIAVDESGNIYLLGSTSSTEFPGTNQTTSPRSGSKVFISKFSNNGTLLYTTLIGGNLGSNSGQGIALDRNGNAYVTGYTNSSEFPTLNAFQSTSSRDPNILGGFVGDAFITKLSNTGSLVFSTLLGGMGNDAGNSIATDNNGNVWITGNTLSSDFPTLNAVQNTYGGSDQSWLDFQTPLGDAFVTKLSSEGSLLYSTFLGGSAAESGRGIAVDSEGNAYVTGITSSDNFPLLNPLQSQRGGLEDAFITKLSPEGQLIYSTYLGGDRREGGESIAVDENQNIYITGTTNLFPPPRLQLGIPPTNLSIPPESSNIGRSLTAFVSKLSSDGNRLIYSTLLGASRDDTAREMVVDRNGHAYVIGTTNSAFFPTINAFQERFNNDPLGQPAEPVLFPATDAFVAKFSPDGNRLEYSSYLGGTGADRGNGIALDNAGNIYITGTTRSVDIPNATGFLLNSMGENNVFLSKISPEGGGEALELPLERLFQFNALENRNPLAILYDEQFYLSQNSDVAEAVAAGILVNGFAHFEASGQFEGRQPSSFYQEWRYLAENPDVAASVAAGAIPSGFEHFRNFGLFEGRDRRIQLFNEGFYLNAYPDIASAVANNLLNLGFNHYIRFGQQEGRNPHPFFDEDFYRDRNPDVAEAVRGGNLSSGFEHFAQSGEREGRQPSPLFNEQFYRTTYPDIDAAVSGGRFRSGFDHFLRFGLLEGRLGVG